MMDARQEKMLEELHDAILGSVGRPGLAEQVRSLESRLSRVEGLVTAAQTTLWAKFWQALSLVGAAGASWFAANFHGTRP